MALSPPRIRQLMPKTVIALESLQVVALASLHVVAQHHLVHVQFPVEQN